ncbi:hypothetical protein HXX76_004233 [Chlamydomonas incerta]|uniref:NAD-dependent epimerase/dehydratase domain-containing protein n=1 Tax=Chlamydomonas incerta TaxID=51695 RepID=A0A835TGW9_CHLIN|nr:hypothetical protein HXX76_004233 [Chlamydomonas incerta]|eukprot:KAG2440119.1 hypothetical protein HXX76_004233 [Chlamydomonas incerta]
MGGVEACRSTVAPHLRGVDGVINCAAHYRWWTRSPDQFRRLNTEAAGELAALVKQAGVRKFVQVSTILAMGSPGGGWGSAARPLQPDTPPGRPASRYAASKAAGDEAVLRVAAAAAEAPAPAASGSGAEAAAPAASGAASGAAAGVTLAAAAPGAPEGGPEDGPAAGGAAAGGPIATEAAARSTGASGVGSAAAAVGPGSGHAAGQGQAVSSSAAGAGAGSGAGSGGAFTACVVALGCVVGADKRLVAGGEEDVMRIADLVRGKVPATLGHETTFTYIGVRDAAAAIVTALHRGQTGRRYLIGNQRLTTGEYYQLISRLSGTPAPKQVVPVWLAAGWAHTAAALAAFTGAPPQAPPDLIRTVAYGTLLYDSSSSEAELGLALPYTDIAQSFAEAVECVKRHDAPQAQQ